MDISITVTEYSTMEYFMDFLRVMGAVTIVLGSAILVQWIRKKLGRKDSTFGWDKDLIK